MVVRKIFSSLLLCLVIAFSAIAQPSLDITISPTRGSVHHPFTITVEVSDVGVLAEPQLVQPNDFDLKHIGSQQEVSSINGSLSLRTKYKYRATARKTGVLKLPIFSLQTSQGTITTTQKTIQVDTSAHDTTTTQEGEVKVHNEFSKTTVYSGEQVLLTTKLQTAVRLENIQIPTPSDVSFWSEQLSALKQYREEDQNGQVVAVFEQTHSIFPLIKEGKIELPPQVITAQAQIADPLADSFFGNLGSFGSSIFRGGIFSGLMPFGFQPVTLSTKPLTLNIIGLPQRTSQPTENEITYSTVIVGNTDITVSIDNSVISDDVPATIKLVITSVGNINNLRQLSMPKLEDFEVEMQQENFGKTLSNGELRGIYTGLYTVSAKRNGNLQFPALELTFFNPNTGMYEVASSAAIPIIAHDIQPKEDTSVDLSTAVAPTTPSEPSRADTAPLQQAKAPLLERQTILWLSLVCLFFAAAFWAYRRIMRTPNFTIPPKTSITSYEQLANLVQEVEAKMGPLHNYPQAALPHYRMALDVLTESKYNPAFVFDQRIFEATRDTILVLCQSMQKLKKKP